MITQEIISKNELIAEFLGMQKTTIGWFDNEETLNFPDSNTFDILNFNSSWDWLMAVIHKIEDLGFEVLIGRISCQINHTLQREDPISVWVCGDISRKLEITYDTIVQFITWHNKQN